jgi:cytoskeletal protein RodZ
MHRKHSAGWDGAAFELGRALAAAREESGISEQELSRFAGIPARFVTIIDQGRLDLIPDANHARGYVRTYASAVGLDQDAVTLMFCRLRRRARFVDAELDKLARP